MDLYTISKMGPTPKIWNFYFKSDFDFFSLDSLCNFLSAFFFNQIWHSSCSFQDKWIWRESKGANTQNDNFLTFFYRIPLKNSCLKYGNIFELAFSKILFFYFNRLKVNIGLYVKWIKKKFWKYGLDLT